MLSHIVRDLILPPSSLLLAFLVSAALYRRQKTLAKGLFGATLFIFYLLSIPLVSLWLSRSAEPIGPVTLEEIAQFGAQGVVVLGVDVTTNATEYNNETIPSAIAMERLEYAAYLAEHLELPVIATGGYGQLPEDSEGQTMARHLNRRGIDRVFTEEKSSNTIENALFSKPIADEHGIKKIALVTSASHMKRAQANFVFAGFEVIAAPTGFRTRSYWERSLLLIVPNHNQFNASCAALRVHMGVIYDGLRRMLRSR